MFDLHVDFSDTRRCKLTSRGGREEMILEPEALTCLGKIGPSDP